QLVAETRSPDQRKGKNLGYVPDQLEQFAVLAEFERVRGATDSHHSDERHLQQITKRPSEFRLHAVKHATSPPGGRTPSLPAQRPFPDHRLRRLQHRFGRSTESRRAFPLYRWFVQHGAVAG